MKPADGHIGPFSGGGGGGGFHFLGQLVTLLHFSLRL